MVEFQLPKLITRVRFPSLAPRHFFMRRRLGSIVLFLTGGLLLSGCVTVDAPQKAAPAEVVEKPVPAPEEKPQGAYHKVQKGETLWRIAQAYNVSISDIIKGNNIPSGAVIEENQLLLIPGTKPVKEVQVLAEEEAESDTFIWPVKGKVVSYFGDWKAAYLNRGIGIEAPEGEPIQASRGGKVVFSDYLNGYGNTVIIHHRDNYFSVYSQNEENLVNVGDDVARGNPIGKVGRKGKSSLLHFEIRKNANPDNPLYYLP